MDEPILMEALKVMRKAVVLAAVCVLAGLAAPPSHAACPGPLGMFNGNGYPILGCPDAKPVIAFAYQPGNPVPTNTGNTDIACEADLGVPPCNTMPGGANVPQDGVVGIATDWSIPTINGCPLGNTNRIYISLQCNDGSGLIASISGQCSALGYSTEAFYDYNGGAPTLDVSAASAKKNGRPVFTSFTRSGGMDMFNVKVDPPTLQSECSAGSLAEAYLAATYCADPDFNCAGLVQPSRGNLYSFTGPCTAADRNPPVRDKAQWALRTLDAAGNALVSLPTPVTGQCNYLGTTMIVGGQESPFIAGYVVTADPNAASARAESVRATKKGNSVEVAFSTSSELGLAGFNVYAGGKAKGGELKLNSGLVAPKGVGGAGASYNVSFAVAQFKGNRSVIVETLLNDGTTLRAEPVDF